MDVSTFIAHFMALTSTFKEDLLISLPEAEEEPEPEEAEQAEDDARGKVRSSPTTAPASLEIKLVSLNVLKDD